MILHQNFKESVSDYWQQHVTGAGRLLTMGDSLRLINGPTALTQYTNAQIDDYQGRPRWDFPWRPPLALTVRARFSHSAGDLRGTAGFGFWNDPFAMTGRRSFTLPRAIWFFYASSASNMKLALQTPGWGWKAATLDAWRPLFLLLAPTAPIAMLLMRWPTWYRRLWPLAQHAMAVNETLLALDMTFWHTYRLAWTRSGASFWVDERLVLHCARPPRGPLGLVVWIDNQGMVVTPWALPRHLLVATEQEQWLELDWLKIQT